MKGILFDFNGTLFNDTHLHKAAWHSFFLKYYGWDLSEEEILRRCLGPSNDDIFKDFFDGKWHVTIPFEKKAKDDVGMIDMAGLNAADIKLVKIGHKHMRAWVVAVESEEIYRAIMRSIWAEQRRQARRRDTVSLTEMMEEPNFDIAADDTIDPACQNQQKGFLAELWGYLETLGKDERVIADAILTKRRDRDVMAELGIVKQSTYSSRKMKIKRQLQKRFERWR